MIALEGKLADRDAWSASGRCPIEAALSLIGTKTSLLLLREAFYGTTRFDDFARRVGVTEASAASRLRDLVAAGLLAKRPYRDEGQRTREEYVLTDAGRDLMPVIVGLFDWGRNHAMTGVRLSPVHRDCGEEVHPELRCSAGHPVGPDDVSVRLRRRTAEHDAS